MTLFISVILRTQLEREPVTSEEYGMVLVAAFFSTPSVEVLLLLRTICEGRIAVSESKGSTGILECKDGGVAIERSSRRPLQLKVVVPPTAQTGEAKAKNGEEEASDGRDGGQQATADASDRTVDEFIAAEELRSAQQAAQTV